MLIRPTGSIVLAITLASCGGAVSADGAESGIGSRPEDEAAATRRASDFEEAALDAEQAKGMLGRLVHETEHIADAVAEHAARGEKGMLFTLEEDGGAEHVEGTLEFRELETVASLDVVFRHWTGRHGGWGYSALDGSASITVRLQADGARLAAVCGTIRLVDDGPLRGAPATSAAFVLTPQGRLEGKLGKRDVAQTASW